MRKYKRIIEVAMTLLLLCFPMMLFGQDQAKVNPYLNYGVDEIQYYRVIPNCFFIQKDSAVSQDYIISLLKELTDSEMDISWKTFSKKRNNIFCRVIVDDSLIDGLIEKLVIDDAVLVARRIYGPTNNSEPQLSENEEGLSNSLPHRLENWFFNEIICFPSAPIDSIVIDSISKSLELTYIVDNGVINFTASKTADIFNISNKLFDSGKFLLVFPSRIEPYFTYDDSTITMSVGAIVTETSFYDMWGNKTDKPSGPTIVVTKKSDGTVHSEKKFFK